MTTPPVPDLLPPDAPSRAAPDRSRSDLLPGPDLSRTGGMVPATPAPTAPPATDTGTPASAFGGMAAAGLRVALGSGLSLKAEQLAAQGVDLSTGPQPLPGVVLRRAAYADRKLRISGDVTIPAVAAGEVVITVDRDGKPRLTGGLRRTLAIPALGNPTVSLTLDEAGAVAGAVENIRLVPPTLGRLRSTVTADLRIAAGRLSGRGTADLQYPGLGTAAMAFRFSEAGLFSGEGRLLLTPPFLPPVQADIAVDEALNLTAQATVNLAGLGSSIPGLVISSGTLVLAYRNGEPSGAVTGLVAAYRNLAGVEIARLVADRATGFTGEGSFTLAVPMIEPVRGVVRVRPEGVSGSLTIAERSFPKGLPVRSGKIVVSLAEDGTVGFRGTVGVDLGPAGRGSLTAAYDQGTFALGADMNLTIPGLRPVHVTVAYADGQISGRADIPVDAERLLGLTGNVTVQYEQGLWSGASALTFSADNGKLSGTVNVTVAQTEKGDLQVGGSGTVTAQLMPKIAGTLTATILPGGGVDVSGTITVTDPVELFPETRTEKELLSLSRNIPLWAILVAVIRLKAGIRAGIGPGVFRNISVTGSYTIGATDADPSFSVTGELYIPAFVEGWVSFGAGLGLDVLLGSLTGGIEGVGTAGLYGAISIVPELSYQDGDWAIEGDATLAAGARLKLGLNAWAEVEALLVTVWEKEWKLAEVVMPVGPDLALRAHMAYRFGHPEPPTLDFTTSDIDADALIQGAMPKDGPPPSGAREALENKAEWKGQLRELRTTPVPPKLAAEAGQEAKPPEPPAKPPATEPPRPKPPETGPPAGSPDPTRNPSPGNQAARSAAVDRAAEPDDKIPPAVPSAQLPAPDKPRYPGPITIATLDEPPVTLPRTREQETEDVNAAKRAIQAVAASTTDTDALDNYFPRIKSRFGLSSIGYRGDFATGFVVAIEINPSASEQPAEKLSGTGLPSLLPARKTKVDYRSRTLSRPGFGPFPVGTRMVAAPLGPDHPLGTKPAAQEDLMALLPEDEYIRGHLLNMNLGGPGEMQNLFPITRSANATHESQIERWVKKWVNEDQYWVEYSVEVVGGEKLEPLPGGRSFVRSELKVEAAIIKSDLSKADPVSTVITSHYQVKSESETPIEAEAIAKLEAGLPPGLKPDRKVAVQVAESGVTHPVFPAEVEKDITGLFSALHTETRVSERLQTYREIGPERARVLLLAYREMQARPDKGDRRILGLEPDEKAGLTLACAIWMSGPTKK
ncbi:hypothetical protein AB0J83_37430 [Actinoplanes sp. NPDC049596]|uniref:hypothetical protein n=1 Tax=unclassified Actinoplanes TaxID=2626549 RepID=UPI00341C91D2